MVRTIYSSNIMKKIIVASTNPVKINASLTGFKQMFPDEIFGIEGVSVPSGVSDQPMSSDETYQGAVHRVNNARKEIPDADFWVGIEGGVEEVDADTEVFAWVVVQSKNEVVSKSRTASFVLPKKVTELIHSGKELGDANDIVFHKTNSKQENGAVGILTGDAIDRTKYYSHAVILALIPFKNEELY